jgi:hypothetical protein
MAFRIPQLLGQITDQDTQFIAALKRYQSILFIGLCGLGVLMLFLIVLTFTGSQQGTWRYAICKVFLERYAEYPPSIKILTAGEKQSSAQIGYMITNAFGSRESELMECFYNVTSLGVQLNRVTVERIPLPQELIDSFNPTINAIITQPDLDTTLPERLPSDIEDLKQDEL